MTTENWGFFRGLSMLGSFGAVFFIYGGTRDCFGTGGDVQVMEEVVRQR
jgi:hypothetical protein